MTAALAATNAEDFMIDTSATPDCRRRGLSHLPNRPPTRDRWPKSNSGTGGALEGSSETLPLNRRSVRLAQSDYFRIARQNEAAGAADAAASVMSAVLIFGSDTLCAAS
jgi:hypothetical protein